MAKALELAKQIEGFRDKALEQLRWCANDRKYADLCDKPMVAEYHGRETVARSFCTDILGIDEAEVMNHIRWGVSQGQARADSYLAHNAPRLMPKA